MLTNRRRNSSNNLSPIGRKWYPLGSSFGYSSTTHFGRNNYNTNKRKRYPN